MGRNTDDSANVIAKAPEGLKLSISRIPPVQRWTGDFSSRDDMQGKLTVFKLGMTAIFNDQGVMNAINSKIPFNVGKFESTN